jgi:2-polyprenyl-6-methoxyphenol hydroxylase-like FAD-dependent oxidoreductase
MTDRTGTDIERRSTPAAVALEADLCVVGAGMSGVACAVTAARLGRRVALLDAAPWVGGQAVGVPIGTIAGLFSCGPREDQRLLSPLFGEELVRRLEVRTAAWPMYSRRARTLIVVYDEVDLERVFETTLIDAGVRIVPGAVVEAVERAGDRVTVVSCATRFGPLTVQAPLFVDASGDAVLSWLAGAPYRVSDPPVYGTQMAVLEHVEFPADEDATAIARRAEELLQTYADHYGLTRRESRVFLLPQRGLAILNATHLPTPLHPVAFWEAAWPARAEAERATQLLRDQYPSVFGRARVRRLGSPGIRQTRTIVGRTRLTAGDVLAGRRFSDAIARAAWPVELHDSATDYRWQPLPDGHLYTIPYGALLPAELSNVLAIGRCIDADPVALSSARVMGPCAAMGVAAAHAADLALLSGRDFATVDVASLQQRLAPNLGED